jgi:hypothetical protein
MTLTTRLAKLEASILPKAPPWKVIMICCESGEDRDGAVDRHLAAHPEDRGANVVIVQLRKMLDDA